MFPAFFIAGFSLQCCAANQLAADPGQPHPSASSPEVLLVVRLKLLLLAKKFQHRVLPAGQRTSGSDQLKSPSITCCLQANVLQTQINEIAERRAAADSTRQGDKAYMQLRQAQQMAAMVGRKKDDIALKLERLQVRKGGPATPSGCAYLYPYYF